MIIKQFESFGKNISFENAHYIVKTIINDCYPTPELHLDKFNIDRKFYEEWPIFHELSDVENITEKDKNLIIFIYHYLMNLKEYSDLPDLQEIDNYFLTLSDITEIELSIRVDLKFIRYDISMIPGEEYEIKDVNLWEEIVQETIETHGRIKDKYKTTLELSDKNIVLSINYQA